MANDGAAENEQRSETRTTNTITGGVFHGRVIQMGSIDGDGLTVLSGSHEPVPDDLGPADTLREEQSEN